MKFRKEKNGTIITVNDWENEIIISSKTTGKVLGSQKFSDQITAIALAKKL